MKYIDADKIRAEIERLKHYAEESKMEWVNEGYNQNAFAEDCRIRSFDKLLTFLDTLPDEHVSDDLEEAAEQYAIPFNDTTYGVEYSFKGFKAGAKWCADHFRDTTKMVNKSLEEAAKEYDEAESWRYEALKYPRREAFEAGANWQKRQMLKNAVEGEVCILPGHVAYVKEKDNESLKQYLLDHFKTGNKVRIIIVREEEE